LLVGLPWCYSPFTSSFLLLRWRGDELADGMGNDRVRVVHRPFLPLVGCRGGGVGGVLSMMRRKHNPNNVDTGRVVMAEIINERYGPIMERVKEIRATYDAQTASFFLRALGAGHDGLCPDCGTYFGTNAVCADCQCIRDTGEQCIYPDMEGGFTIGG
jgi:hypothetical protein